LASREWGITPSQAINFANITVIAQLLWGSVWFINAFNTNFKILESITVSAYKVAMGLPGAASNKTSWAISAQPSIKRRISNMCNKFIFKAIQLKKVIIIINRIQNFNHLIKSRRVPKHNILFLILRWNKSELLLNNLQMGLSSTLTLISVRALLPERVVIQTYVSVNLLQTKK